jgi:hypothetical protein
MTGEMKIGSLDPFASADVMQRCRLAVDYVGRRASELARVASVQ